MNRWRIAPLLVLVAALLLEPGTAQAYLDPSTGAMLLSGIVSLVVTAWLAMQTYWHKLARVLRRSGAASDPSGADDPTSGDVPGA